MSEDIVDAAEQASSWVTDTPFFVSFIQSAGATRIDREPLTLTALAERILLTTGPDKASLPWLKMAGFGTKKTAKGSLRHDANLQFVTGIEADYDGGEVTFDEAQEILTKQGLLALLYTSPSHTEDVPRWRVLCPLSEPVIPAKRAQYLGRLNGLFRGIFAVESWTLSQAYYYGRVGENPSHDAVIIDGTPIDQHDDLDVIWLGKPAGMQPGTTDVVNLAAYRHAAVDEAKCLDDLVSGKTYHQAKVRLIGLWARAGVAYGDARQRLVAAFQAAPEADKKTKRWRDRYADIDRCLEDLYGKEAAKRDARAIGVRASETRAGLDHDEPSERGNVLVKAGRPDVLATQAEQALLEAGIALYQRGRELVRPVLQEVPASKGRTTVTAGTALVTTPNLIDMMAQSCDWSRWDGREKMEVPANPPKIIAEIIQARVGRWQFPPLAGVITTPTLRPDGSLLSAEGYDPATRLYLAKDKNLIPYPIPERPTKADAAAALAFLDDLLAEFPFKSPVDRAVALSGMLTPVLRGAVSVAPLHALCAHTAGTGKSYLADVIAAIATGREMPAISMGSKPEETESRLIGALLAGYTLINLDNCNGELGGDFLCQAVERPLVRVRRLGSSDMYDVETKASFYSTGNNLRMRGDMTRRALKCALDAQMERPETKRFDRRPVEEVLAARGKYVAAILTIARAYIVAGYPGKLAPLNSFEEWSDLVRSPLVWLGQPDPCDSMEDAREDDPELSNLSDVLNNWVIAVRPAVGAKRNAAMSVRMLIEHANTRAVTVMGEHSGSEWAWPHFRDALLSVGGVRGELNSNRLGKWLRDNLGRIAQGRRIVKGEPTASGLLTWAVQLDWPYARATG